MTVYVFQIYMYSVYKLNKLILYYFNTFLILYYIFPVQIVVLDSNCAVGCGPAWNGLTPKYIYFIVCWNEQML